MELRVVGCSAGAPTNGACPCYVVESASGVVLLDCGPGSLQHVWQSGLMASLDSIVVSHMHSDHVLDLVTLAGDLAQDALRRARDDRPLGLCLPRARGVERIELLAHALGFDADRFLRRFDVIEVDESVRLAVGDMTFRFVRTEHPELCYATRLEGPEGALVYGADGAYSESLVEFARDAGLLLLEATYTEIDPRHAAEGHMTGEQAADVARGAGATLLVLTHVAGAEQGTGVENVRRARARFPGRVELARPGAVYRI